MPACSRKYLNGSSIRLRSFLYAGVSSLKTSRYLACVLVHSFKFMLTQCILHNGDVIAKSRFMEGVKGTRIKWRKQSTMWRRREINMMGSPAGQNNIKL